MFDPKRYPPDWKEISHYIRFVRAGGKCEHPDCGVKHGARGARDRFGKWHDEADIHSMKSDDGFFLFGEDFDWKMTTIVLTVHHIGIRKEDGSEGSTHDKFDCRPENLISYCQKHHLEADMPTHIANRKITLAKKRAAKIATTGQQSFLGGES